MAALFPDAEVSIFHLGVQPRLSANEVASELSKHDFVITQFERVAGGSPVELDRLREATRCVEFVPPVVFTGFHPDCIYVLARGACVPSPIGQYHSAIALAGFLLNLPSHQTALLFNSYVYRQLGYFDAYQVAKDEFLADCLRQGYDLSVAYNTWFTEGPFMHTINHPKIRLLATFTKLAASRAGLIDPMVPTSSELHKHLGHHVAWPVYPELAEAIGVEGGLQFRQERAKVATGAPQWIGLEDLLRLSYQEYSKISREQLCSPVNHGYLRCASRLACFLHQHRSRSYGGG